MSTKKLAIICRAISASGKSTMSQAIAVEAKANGLSVSIHSTDNYFLTANTEYVFQSEKLAEYHEANQKNFETSLRENTDIVVCDNTNLTPWEAHQYAQLARHYGYYVVLLNFLPRDLAEHLAAQQGDGSRAAHGLNEEAIIAMKQKFDEYGHQPNEASWAGEFGADEVVHIQPDLFVQLLKIIPVQLVSWARNQAWLGSLS